MEIEQHLWGLTPDGEAVVLYLLGVPLLVFFRKNGVMEKLMKEKR